MNEKPEYKPPIVEELDARGGSSATVGSGLLADITRCFGGGCKDADNCLRYQGRNDNLPMLSYIQGGVFEEGVCIYRIAPNVKADARESASVASSALMGAEPSQAEGAK